MADIAAVTQVEITAKDSTQSAFNSVKGGITEVKNVVGGLQAQFAGLAGALSLGVFAGAIKEAIDFADHLNDLHQRTGLEVEMLGALGYAASSAGTDLDSVAKGASKLANQLVDAATGGKESKALFDALGISATNLDGSVVGLDDVLEQLADRFAAYPDGPEKAAAANKIFGDKLGAQMIPLLNLGSEGLRQMKADYQKYGGVTTATAQRADAFNDSLAKIHLTQGAFIRTVASEALPTLQTLANMFLDAKEKGGGFKGMAEGLVTALKGLVAGGMFVAEVFRSIGNSLGAVGAIVTAVLEGDFKRAAAINKEANADLKANWEATSQRISDVWNATGGAVVETSKRTAKEGGKALLDALRKVGKDGVDPLTKQFDALIVKLKQDLATATAQATAGSDTLTASQKEFLKLQESPLWNQLTNKQREIVTNFFDQIGAQEDVIQSNKDLAKAAADTKAAYDKFNESQLKDLKSLDDQIARQTAANATFGLGKTALIEYAIAENERQQQMAAGVPGEEAEIARLEARRLKLLQLRDATAIGEALEQNKRDLDEYNKEVDRQLKEEQKYWQRMFDAVVTRSGDFVRDVIDRGWGPAFKRLWDDFKAWGLRALADIAAKQVIVSITGAVGLTGAGGAAANSVLGAGGGGGAGGGILSAIGSLFGSGASTLSMFGSDVMQLVGQGLGLGEALSMATSAAGGLVSVLSAAAPWAAAIVAGGTLIASLFSKGGGPKVGGAANTGIAGFNMYPGETSTENNAALAQVVGANSSSYQAILAALGGRGTANFGLSYDTDPQGTAANRVSAGATVNGRSVYGIRDVDVGRDQAALEARLTLESKRTLLAALQASEFPAEIAGIFNSINVATASAASIDKIFAYANAVGVVNQALANIGQIGPDLDKLASYNVVDAFRDQGNALDELIANYDGSVEATNQLSAASSSYYTSLVQLVTQVKNVQRAVDEMFGSTYNTIFLSGRDDAFLTKYYQEQQRAGLESLSTLTDPAAIQAAGKKINDAILAMWNMFTPEQQAINRDWFLTQTTDANNAVNNRLTEIVNNATSAATTDLTQFKDLLTTAASKFDGAADKSVKAADTNLAAANAPQHVIVDLNVHDDRVTANQVFAS